MVQLNFCRAVTINKNLINDITRKYFSKSSCLFEFGDNVRKRLLVPVQKEKDKKPRRISVIGAAGIVGITTAYNLVRNPICDELVLIDIPDKRKKLCGEALDLLHASCYIHSPRIKIGVDFKLTAKSDVIIVTCGFPRKPGQTRNDLVQINVDIFKQVIPPLAKFSPDCVFIVAANPVDIVAYATWKYSGFDKNRVIGAGTEIDTARLRYFCSQRLGINPYSTEITTILEHGEHNIPLWAQANVAGSRLRDVDRVLGCCVDPNNWNKLHDDTQAAGGTLNKWKGCTNFNIAVINATIAQSVLQDSRMVHYVAICAKGFFDIDTDCFMTFPAVVGNRGVLEIVQQVYDDDVIVAIRKGACAIQKFFDTVKF